MQNIPAVGNYNTTGVNGYSQKGKQEKDVKEKDANLQSQEKPATSMSADEVFAYMAGNSLGAVANTKNVDAPKVIKISDYVDAESAARIAESMGMFLDATAPMIAEGIQNGLSESAAQVLAAANFEKENY